MAVKKDITLTVGDKELKFTVGIEDYNRYINELDMKNKIVPSKRFLKATLTDKEDLPVLEELLTGGLAIDLTGALIEEFRPAVEISVKK